MARPITTTIGMMTGARLDPVISEPPSVAALPDRLGSSAATAPMQQAAETVRALSPPVRLALPGVRAGLRCACGAAGRAGRGGVALPGGCVAAGQPAVPAPPGHRGRDPERVAQGGAACRGVPLGGEPPDLAAPDRHQ